MSEDSRQIERLHDRLRLMSDVTRRFAETTTDYRRLLDSIAQGLASVVGEACLVMLLSEDGAALELAAAHAPDAKVLAQLREAFAERPLLLAEQPWLRAMLARGEPLLEPSFGADAPSDARKRWQGVGLHSALVVPLRVAGRSLGALLLGRFRPETPAFDAGDRELSRNLADHASLAIDNARLYRAAQDAASAADESERRLQRTLEVMQEGYTILSHDLRYVYVNAAGARHTRLSKEQLLNHSPMELYPHFVGSNIHRALLRALAGTPQRVEEEFLHADGAEGYFELNIQPVPEGLVVLSVDATERRRAELRRDALEEQLRQAQKMEAVGRLAGGIAHDFNNLLSVILGYGEDMLKQLPPEHPLREDVLEIHQASTRAAELTRQLLTFSRQQVLEHKVLDLNEVIKGLQRMVERVLGENSELVLQLDPALGYVRADRGHLEQVCMNLAVNARDAMSGGGKLTIETSNAELDEAFVREHLGTEPGRYVVMAVSDTGVGMDRATRARAFEPFFSTKQPGKGTGLGLSTVFGIVQQSGGGIWVYSEPGRGTTFKLYFPRVDGELDRARPAVVPAVLGGDETILLVEDDEHVRAIARRILERQGYQVLAPGDSEQALRFCSEYSGDIDLLVTDVIMPRVNGSQLATRLRQKFPALKVLYVSGYTDGGINAGGVLEDGASFLQKPFTSESLSCKVRNLLDDGAERLPKPGAS